MAEAYDYDFTDALQLAAYAHDGQVDKSGHPYIMHPVVVASNVARDGFDTRFQVAAVLHDTLEDTGLSLNKILRDYGEEIAAAVLTLTRVAPETYQTYIARILTNDIATVVKWHDVAHNLDRNGVIEDHDTRVRLFNKYTRAQRALLLDYTRVKATVDHGI